MLVEVTYQTIQNAAKKYCELRRTEFFESSTLPDKPTIAAKLSVMRKDFAENTILISEFERDDAYSLKNKGFRITQL